MKRKLRGILVAIVLIVYSVPFCAAVSESSGNSLNEGDDTLYFQTTQVPYAGDGSLAWLMNVSMSSGQAKNSTTQYRNEFFVSPPLLKEFTFQTITLTMYHERVPSGAGAGIFALYVFLYFIDTGGTSHLVTYGVQQLAARSEVDSLSLAFTNLLQGEKILLVIFLHGDTATPLNIYWGNSTYPSQISYAGNVFVPEFPSFLILPLLMITTLVVVVWRSKKGYTLER